MKRSLHFSAVIGSWSWARAAPTPEFMRRVRSRTSILPVPFRQRRWSAVSTPDCPAQIRVLSARPVAASFHARKSALGKLYTYRARWREPKLPWLDQRSAAVGKISDSESFSAALDLFVGRHDWASFTVPNPGTESTTRTLFRVRLRHRHQGVDLDFFGEGFLRYQVRRMVGALLEVGSGTRGVNDLRNLIANPRPGDADPYRPRPRSVPRARLLSELPCSRRCAAVGSELSNVVMRPCGRLPDPGDDCDAAS